MGLIPEGQNLFVVDLKYTTGFNEIDPLIDGHMAFLERQYASGAFIASGAKVPRTGGVIIATAPSQDALQDILAQDPFHQNNVALYTVTEFKPGMRAKQFDM